MPINFPLTVSFSCVGCWSYHRQFCFSSLSWLASTFSPKSLSHLHLCQLCSLQCPKVEVEFDSSWIDVHWCLGCPDSHCAKELIFALAFLGDFFEIHLCSAKLPEMSLLAHMTLYFLSRTHLLSIMREPSNVDHSLRHPRVVLK